MVVVVFFAKVTHRWGKETADDFAELCGARAREAQNDSRVSFVAKNGTVLEQSQILTTHNLAVLTDALGLQKELAQLAPDLADRAFAWVIRRQAQPTPNWIAALRMVKNTAYAWRQGIFFLSFCDTVTQQAAVTRLREMADHTAMRTHFAPAISLGYIVAGGRFNRMGTVDGGPGRRFLGWSAGPHWCLIDAPSKVGRTVQT